MAPLSILRAKISISLFLIFHIQLSISLIFWEHISVVDAVRGSPEASSVPEHLLPQLLMGCHLIVLCLLWKWPSAEERHHTEDHTHFLRVSNLHTVTDAWGLTSSCNAGQLWKVIPLLCSLWNQLRPLVRLHHSPSPPSAHLLLSFPL